MRREINIITGEEIELPDVEVTNIVKEPVPQRLTNYQGKVTLDAFRLFDEVDEMMQADDTPRAAKLAWATGSFERQGYLVIHFANVLGLTQEQVDQMFIYGASVE